VKAGPGERREMKAFSPTASPQQYGSTRTHVPPLRILNLSNNYLTLALTMGNDGVEREMERDVSRLHT